MGIKTRTLCRAFTIIGFSLSFIACAGAPAKAMSSARLDIALQLTQLTRQHSSFDAAAAWSAAARAYRIAGVDPAILGVVPTFLAACMPLPNIRAPEPTGPGPGDVAVFQPQDVSQSVGVAFFISNAEVVVRNPANDKFELIPVAALDGAGTTNQTMRYARQGSVSACRLAPQFWPRGHDDVSIAPGHIELVDPAVAARQIDWVERHPRDPDQSLSHSVWRGVVGMVAWVSGAVGFAFSTVLRAGDWALHHIPIVGGLILGVIGFLTKRFDGSGIHHVLSYILGGIPFVIFKGMSFAANAVGWHGVARTLSDVGQGAVKFTGFVVTLLTGLQGEGKSTVGGVGIAAVSDVLLVAKPLAVGTRVAAGVRGLEAGVAGKLGAVTILDRVSDVIVVRPLALGKTLFASRNLAANVRLRAADLFSLAWRPEAKLHEAVDQIAFALKTLAGRSHSLESAAAAAEQVNHVLDAASATGHVNDLANNGSLPTAKSPARLRPHQFLGLSDR